MRIDRVVVGPLETNCWIASDDIGGPAVVIDPGGDVDLITSALSGREVAAIILTHGHFDHLGAVTRVRELSGAPLVVHKDDAAHILSAQGTGGAPFGFEAHAETAAERLLADGDTVQAGSLTLRVLHTPGHTPGGISLFADDTAEGPPQLFSGDTLFAGSVGRTDFPGGDARVLARSIAEKLAPLPSDTIVHPGHGPDTSIGRESRVNPFWPRA